ncbi:MAG TPA: alpha/beta hydrolase family protein [Clostridia bacterium]|nr:alpha/beta hydrolase family protein [Clostridia bacterium]
MPQREQGIGVRGAADDATRYPVLWLLHGASDDHTIWLRRTSIERYVAPLGLAVVMPSVHLSRYANMAHGPRYFDYVTRELPEALGGVFPLSRRREDNYVAGLSMGGYGAMKMGLAFPDQYAAIGCFSSGNLIRQGTLTMLNRQRTSGKASMLEAVYGVTDPVSLMGDPQSDLFAMAEAAEASGHALPRIFHACGTEDFLLDNARLTAQWFAAHPAFAYTYREGPGSHDWAFWDLWIQTFLAWLFPENPKPAEA